MSKVLRKKHVVFAYLLLFSLPFIAALATTSCLLDNEPVPTRESTRPPDGYLPHREWTNENIARLSKETKELRQDIEELRNAGEGLSKRLDEQAKTEKAAAKIAIMPTKAMERTADDNGSEGEAREAPTATASPTFPPIPTPSGPGICGRSPYIQQLILYTLRTSSCRIVANEELFRITRLVSAESDNRGVSLHPELLNPGDFVGLVNLEEVSIRGRGNAYDDKIPLPSGVFVGAGISKLSIDVAHLSPGIFRGMVSLESLNISGEGLDFSHLKDPVLSQVLELGLGSSQVVGDLSGDELDIFVSLEKLDLYLVFEEDERHANWRPEAKPPLEVPASLLSKNTRLRNVALSFGVHSGKNTRDDYVVHYTFLNHLHGLGTLRVSGDFGVLNRPPTNSGPLALSPSSPLGKYLRESEERTKRWQRWEEGDSIDLRPTYEE